MKDEFLYSTRPPVRIEFRDYLSRRLSQIEMDNPVKKEKIQMRRTFPSFNWKYALLLSALVMIMTIAISAPARAMTLEWIKTIAGFFIEEQDESPLKNMADDNISPIESSALMSEENPSTATLVQPTEYVVATSSLPDVLENLPFIFCFPAWVPEGFSLDPNVGVSNSGDWVALLWQNPNLSVIELLAEKEYTGYNIPAGVDSAEEIEINGESALLIRGFWDAQHQWNPDLQISLDWKKDGHHYHLGYSERGPLHYEMVPITSDEEIIIQNLIKMAESFQ